MNGKEREELRELRDRLIKLETMIELEFKHMKDDWKLAVESIRKLNEEYGALLQCQAQLESKHASLEAKFKESVANWKFAAVVISPMVTTLIIAIVQHFFHFLF